MFGTTLPERPCAGAQASRRSSWLLLSGHRGPRRGAGIYPGDAPKDAYRLPAGFEPVLQLRHLLLRPGKHQRGESVAWRSAAGRACAARGGATCSRRANRRLHSQRLYGPDGKAAPSCSPRIRTRSRAGEPTARSASPARRSPATGQLVNRPSSTRRTTGWCRKHGRGVHAGRPAKDVSYIGGLHHKEKVATRRAPLDANVARDGERRASPSPAGTYRFAKTGYLRLDERTLSRVQHLLRRRQVPDRAGRRTGLTLGAQYFRSPRSATIRSDRLDLGLRAQAAPARGPFGVPALWTQTGKERDTLNPSAPTRRTST